MKKISRRKNPTIKHKLIGIIVGYLLLFSVLVFSMTFWFERTIEEKIGLLAKQSLETLTGNLEVYINNNVRLSNTIASESSMMKLMRENPDFSSSSAVWSMVQMLDKLKNFSMMNNYIYSIAIYNPQSGKVLSTADGIYDLDAKQAPWLERVQDHPGALFIGADLEGALPQYSRNDNSQMFSLIRKLPGRGVDNILLISTNKQVLNMFIGDIDLWQGTGVVISDSEGSPVYTVGNPALQTGNGIKVENQKEQTLYSTASVNNDKYIVVQKSTDLAGWHISMYIPQQEIMKDVLVMRRWTIWILVGITWVAILLFTVLYLQIFDPIKKLMKGMQTVEKGLNFQPLQIKRMDELGFLQQRFNYMVQNEQQMRKTIYEEQLHKKEIELKFLQSQVNPHFLYNTLDSIYWVAEECGAEEISDVVLDLSKFFRLSLSKGKDFVTVRETHEHLQSYIRIQQFRHTEKFEVKWHIDDAVADVEIMKLMLQPVVENAIIHGLEKTAETCKLEISIAGRGDFLECTVSDTGTGMENDHLEQLIKEIKREDGPSGATYGLKNLYQRLKILYEDDTHFQIWSQPGAGTKVTIAIRLTQLGRRTNR